MGRGYGSRIKTAGVVAVKVTLYAPLYALYKASKPVLSHVYDHVKSVYEVIRKTFKGDKKVKNLILMALFVTALFCLFYFKNKLKCKIHSTPGTNAIVAAGTLTSVGILHNLNK